MTRLHGVDYEAGKALFEVDNQFVVVDINKRDVLEVGETQDAITASAWLKVSPVFEHPKVWSELAEAAVTQLDVQETEIAPVERKFKIPDAVKVEAQQAIDWNTQFERGTSAVGRAFAQKLLTETFITASDVARMNRYFNRISRHTLSTGWSPGQQGYPTDERIRFAMRGGAAAQSWVSRIVAKHGLTASGEVDGNQPHEFKEDPDIPDSCIVCGRDKLATVHTAVVASAFEYDETCEYFGHGLDPDTTLVDGLLMLSADETWKVRENGLWHDTEAPGESEVVILLDEESAYKLAEIIDDQLPENPDILPFELATLNPHEAALAAIAEEDEDWELVERVFDIYDSQERSINAQKQGRASGGRFGETPDAPGKEEGNQQGTAKARLPQPLPLVPDVAARIAEYLAANGGAPAGAPAPAATDEPVQAAGLDAAYLNALIEKYGDTELGRQELAGEEAAAPAPAQAQPATDAAAPRPLYLAIVDKIDTEAVLDVVSLMPGNPPVMWKRDAGAWVQAPEILASLQSTQPPPVVELTDDSILADVLTQVDEATSGTTEEAEAAPAPGATEQNPDGSSGAKPDANPDQHPIAASSNSEFVHPELDMFRTWSSAAEKEKYAGKGYALPDGSFPIPDVAHLKKAVKAYGRAKNKSATKKHIMKRAKALKRVDLIPTDWKSSNSTEYTMWGPHGELLNLAELAEGGLDRNRGGAEELRKYWTRGTGGAKIGWNTPGDMTRCMRLLAKYLKGREAGYCALRHREMTGRWPGERDEDGNL